MVIKVCKICGKEFEARTPAKCCSPECTEINKRNNQNKAKRKYNKSEKGRASQKKYQKTEKFKVTQQRYIQSDKGKTTRKLYAESEKGKAVHKKANKNYMKKKIDELNKQYNGDLKKILENIPVRWMEREAIMQVWFNESYYDGVIAKIESTPVCEVTGEKTNDLIIHHLYSFNTHPELGNDPANMVRIKKEIHNDFHNIYGRGNNTPEQWIEFIKNRR